MFGMLDYRAHKLFWLVTFPFRLIARLAFFVIVVIAILIARWTEYSPLIQIVVAYVTMEAIAMVFVALWALLVSWPIQKIFFWLVDVMPSRGENDEEAKEVVCKGQIIWLSKKLSFDIDNWTFEDTDNFVSCLHWRARIFFNARENFVKRLSVLQRLYDETGKQPGSFPQVEIEKILKPLNPGWFETAIVNPHFFNSIMGATIIVLVILYGPR
jgi:hypothetical protein